MSPELRRYYEKRLSMMGDEAWKDLMDDIEKMVEANNRLDGVETEAQLHFRKGEVSMMKWFLGIREVSESAYQELLEEENEESS